jgi:hypothetical protein
VDFGTKFGMTVEFILPNVIRINRESIVLVHGVLSPWNDGLKFRLSKIGPVFSGCVNSCHNDAVVEVQH